MIEFDVQLMSVPDVKRFISIACMQDFEIDIICNRQTVNAKSIMAVFSLDLSKPLHIEADCGEEEGMDFLKAVEEFIVADALKQASL